MSIVNLKIHTLTDEDVKYAAQVHLRGAMQADALTAHVLQMPGIVSIAEL